MSGIHDGMTGCITEPSPLDLIDGEKAASVAPGLSNPLRLLVLEDNKDTADSLAILLRYWGSNVRVYRNAAEALAALDYPPGRRPDRYRVAEDEWI
jgi:hypothetical protein